LRLGFDPDGNVKGMQETPLFLAAKGGHMAILELLLEYGADMHTVVDGHAFSEQKLTAIHVAAEGGHEAVVRLLLLKGVGHKTPCDDGYEPLQAAIEADNENIVRLLLDYGADPGATTILGENSLHYDARKASKSIVELLLSKRVDHNARGYLERTPLHEAAKFGRLAALTLLLDLGANPNTPDRLGQTPLHHAVMFGLFNPVRLLLERGADPHTSTRNEPLFHLLIFESYFSLEPKEASSLPAESEDQRLIASLLTQHGVDINAVHKTNSETVLVKAIRNKWLTMAHFLLDLGAKPTAPAIHAAVWFGFGDVVAGCWRRERTLRKGLVRLGRGTYLFTMACYLRRCTAPPPKVRPRGCIFCLIAALQSTSE
jgi:ankyrin repeat protein